MKDLLFKMEEKMESKKKIEFVMKDNSVTTFSIATKYLNVDLMEVIQEIAQLQVYAQSLNVEFQSEVFIPLVMIKYFVKQVKVGNKGKETEVEVIKKEKSIKDTYEMLVRYGNALLNIENKDGVSLYETFLKEIEANKEGLNNLSSKVKTIKDSIVNSGE